MNIKNPAGNYGYTPLHYAAQEGHFNVCKLITENVHVKNPSNDQGETPLSLATQSGHNEICKLFTKRRKVGLDTIQNSKKTKK